MEEQKYPASGDGFIHLVSLHADFVIILGIPHPFNQKKCNFFVEKKA